MMLQTAPKHLQIAKVLHAELEKVGVIFSRQLQSDLDDVNALCEHVERYRGKMLRPTLLLLTALAVDGDPCDGSAISPRHRTVATVLEMIHMATLVHDDVLDEADFRRRGATVNSLRGNETAVMLGDYLISNAFHLCSTEGDPSINELLGAVTNTLCEGELVQLSNRDNFDLDVATYMEILRRKTAILVGACCRLGATLSNATDAVVDAAERFGSHLGIAFQIQDDLLDLLGDLEVVGKSTGRDIATGKLTLPILLHLEGESEDERLKTVSMIKKCDQVGLRDRLAASGAIDAARAEAHRLVSEAKSGLAVFEPSSARDLLHSLADAVVDRQA
jgi:octaprenyl-diphosphate synthase